MAQDKAAMVKALKELCLPRLREQGFKGSFPHMFRDVGDFVELITFQFFSSGGSLCVEIGFADPCRENVHIKKDSPPSKLRVSVTRERCRLGAPTGGDRWFSFGPTSYGEYRGAPLPVEEIALDVQGLLLDEAEAWWGGKRQASPPSGDPPA
jgi:hypothetical protein